MRHYKIVPWEQIKNSSLSKNGLKRLLWIDWYYSHGRNAELTCRHFNISKSVFYRWFNRYDKNNLKTLEFNTKTRRPHRLREMTTPLWIRNKVYCIRKGDPEKSKYEIQAELGSQGIQVGQTAIGKIIKRHPALHNAQHKKRVRKHRNYKIARIKAAIELREKNLGSLLQVDTKHLYILGIRFYLFVAIDCKSRYGFVWCYKNASSLNAADFLLKVIDYFPFPIQAVNTDNGSEYLLNFHKTCQRLNIPHYFTYPYTPKMNGRVERLIQTVEYEYFNYQDDLLPNLNEINKRCIIFNNKYNNKRYHRAISYRTPYEFVMVHLQKGGQPFSM
jgi:transposase InsO family protein